MTPAGPWSKWPWFGPALLRRFGPPQTPSAPNSDVTRRMLSGFCNELGVVAGPGPEADEPGLAARASCAALNAAPHRVDLSVAAYVLGSVERLAEVMAT